MDIDYADIAKGIGAVLVGDSDTKFDGKVNEIGEEKYFDATSGEPLDHELVTEARSSRDGDISEARRVREEADQGVLGEDG